MANSLRYSDAPILDESDIDPTPDLLPECPSPDLLDYWQDRSDLFAPPRNDHYGD